MLNLNKKKLNQSTNQPTNQTKTPKPKKKKTQKTDLRETETRLVAAISREWRVGKMGWRGLKSMNFQLSNK